VIEVVNFKAYGRPREPWDVYIGRRNRWAGLLASPLGNPFRGADAVERFAEYLRNAIATGDPGVVEELARLRLLHAEHGRLVLI